MHSFCIWDVCMTPDMSTINCTAGLWLGIPKKGRKDMKKQRNNSPWLKWKELETVNCPRGRLFVVGLILWSSLLWCQHSKQDGKSEKGTSSTGCLSTSESLHRTRNEAQTDFCPSDLRPTLKSWKDRPGYWNCGISGRLKSLRQTCCVKLTLLDKCVELKKNSF